MAYLTVKNLSVGYENRVVAENIDFVVNQGDYLCIVGENGSGKSTLMKTLLGLKSPTSGEIIFGDGLKRNEIGYLPQQTAAQRDFPASVYEVVLSGCVGKNGWKPFYSGADRALAKDNIEKMGISDLANKCYRELSGGQQQRVLLARALCATKRILLLDEPVAGLDPRVTVEMYHTIAQLNADGVTIIMISHDIAAVKYASQVLHIGHRPLFFGTKEDYIASDVGKVFFKTEVYDDDN